MNEISQRPEPMTTIKKLVRERYAAAKTIFWAGSVAQKKITSRSDLDLVIIYDHLENAYREAFIYDSWPIDTFVHDPATIEYFFNHIDKNALVLALPRMVVEGIEITETSDLSRALKDKAQTFLDSSPVVSAKELERRRFQITDAVDDLEASSNSHETMTIAFELYRQLAELYLLTHHQWLGSGKQLARLLKAADVSMAQKFESIFSQPLTSKTISEFAEEILAPCGGFLWDGFKSEAPKEFRIDQKRPCQDYK